MANKKLILFKIEGCPFCRKAEEVLDAKGVSYEKVEVPKPHAERKILETLSGQTSVPILVEVIGSENQDDDIIEWANKNY